MRRLFASAILTPNGCIFFFLNCLRYAAQRNVLFTSAANILGETWSSSSAGRKLNVLLYVVGSVNYDVNCVFFTKYKAL